MGQSGRIVGLRPVETAGVRGATRGADEIEVLREGDAGRWPDTVWTRRTPSSYATSPTSNRNSGGSIRTHSSRRRTRRSSVTSAPTCASWAPGYTGLWTALLAKERDPDREVVVVEQYETGAGASGRNGGFCSASLTHGYLNGVRRFPDEIELIQRLGRENLDEIEATVARYSIECNFERTGELQVAVAPWQFKGMAEQAERRNAMGDSVEVLSQEEVQSRVHSPSYVGALFDHDGTALVDPARLVWGLERVCISLGVKIFENSKVEWLEDLHDAVRVHTPYGAVTAARVALGTNVFPSLLKKTRKYVVPVYDYVMVTEPLSDAQLESIGWSGREGSPTRGTSSTTTGSRVTTASCGAATTRSTTSAARSAASTSSTPRRTRRWPATS